MKKTILMPLIFMRSNVDTNTGKTKCGIIDGKQRLQTITGVKEAFLCQDY